MSQTCSKHHCLLVRDLRSGHMVCYACQREMTKTVKQAPEVAEITTRLIDNIRRRMR